jgi:HEAT repeat protein
VALTVVAAAAIGWHGTASAQSSDPAALRVLLLRHHEPPTVEAVQAVTEDPVAALTAVAEDRSETTLVRRRAATMLGRLPGERSETVLAGLLRYADQGAIRRAAARALSRLLESRPAELVPLLGDLLESPEPDDRETAVWLLADVDTPAARARLSRHRIVERHRGVVHALRRAGR